MKGQNQNMDNTTKQKLSLFVENTNDLKKEFVWQNALVRRLVAMQYAKTSKPVDCEAIQRCHKLIKESTGVFSTFRGNLVLFVAALLSMSNDPRKQFDDTLKVYGLLKETRLRASDYLVVAAYEIAAQANPYDFVHAADRTRAFYDGMKSNRFFLTGYDDYIFAAMLGLSDLDVVSGTERIERLYSRLKGEFWDRNSTQALAQVLVLGGSDDTAIERVLALRDAFRERKIKMDKSYTLSTLGILAMLPVEIDTIVHDIGEAFNYMRAQKGFGPWSVTTQELLLFAAGIVAYELAKNISDGVLSATLSTSIANIIIAQQAAMIAAVSASTAAAAASS